MKHLSTIVLKGMMIITLFFCMSNIYAQSRFKGYIYDLNADNYFAIKYTRTYRIVGNEFVTKYTIYHPTKGYAWMTVTAIHNKSDKTVKVSVDDTNEGIFSHINDEDINYEILSLKPFGYRGGVGELGGKRIPNQLLIKFAGGKFENVKVVHILGSAQSDFDNIMYFILDERN